MADEAMNREEAVAGLNKALEQQYRSAIQFTIAAGTVEGFEHQFLAGEFWKFARLELDDARRLVEKIVALGGEPAAQVAELRSSAAVAESVEWLLQTECDAVDTLRHVIPMTGTEGEGEALEHLLEHMIMRKQEQVDFLLRAARGARTSA